MNIRRNVVMRNFCKNFEVISDLVAIQQIFVRLSHSLRKRVLDTRWAEFLRKALGAACMQILTAMVVRIAAHGSRCGNIYVYVCVSVCVRSHGYHEQSNFPPVALNRFLAFLERLLHCTEIRLVFKRRLSPARELEGSRRVAVSSEPNGGREEKGGWSGTMLVAKRVAGERSQKAMPRKPNRSYRGFPRYPFTSFLVCGTG